MRRTLSFAALVLLVFSSRAEATPFTFNTDPFAGSTALTTPGRQIVGGEASITFNIATDTFLLGQAVFGIGDTVQFVNDLVGNLPTSGINTIVLLSFDNDSNPATPFGAGNAADLIAGQITVPTPGFFVYFNQGLDLPRLVYSTDLNDNTSDLKILFRLTNLTGAGGRSDMSTFTAANFGIIPQTVVPEPATLFMLGGGIALLLLKRARQQKRD